MPAPQKLNQYASNLTSQHGEDGILGHLAGVLGDKMIPRVCEFGAADGVRAANTWQFWHERGWAAVLLEADPGLFQSLVENARDRRVVAINARVQPRGRDSLDDLFRERSLDPNLGILSIDIDSYDYHVWKHLDYVQAQVVVIEFNQHIPPMIDYYDPEGEVFLRCSAKALERLGREKGYHLVACTRVNAIFLRDDLFDPGIFTDLPVEALFDWGEVAPILIRVGDRGNKFPIWHTRARPAFKLWVKLYYRLSSWYKRGQRWVRPSRQVQAQLRRAGLDF